MGADGSGEEEALRRVRGVAAVGLLEATKPHTARMPESTTTDPRCRSTRLGGRLGRGAGERERERPTAASARESGVGDGTHWRQPIRARSGGRAALHPPELRGLKPAR